MSNLSENIKTLTKSYYDTQLYIHQLNKKIQEVREKKKDIESKLINEIKRSGLQEQAITYNGKKVYMHQTNLYDTLSYKFLAECLIKLYNGDKNKVAEVIKFIKTQRSKQSTDVIRMK
jgi:hypothetical protein